MTYYMITNGSGEFIYHDRMANKFVKIRSMDLGTKWESVQKAENIRNGLASNLRNGFYVIKLESPNIAGLKNFIRDKTKPATPLVDEAYVLRRMKEATDGNVEPVITPVSSASQETPREDHVPSPTVREANSEADITDKIDMIVKLTQEIISKREELDQKQSDINKEIVDLQHYIEFRRLNAYEGYMAFKMLQDALRRRRKIKDEISITLSLDNIKTCVDGLDSRHYNPRILHGLVYTKEANAK